MTNAGIKVFAPASVANISVGFDILGLALEHPGDEIIARRGNQKGLTINKITGDKGKLPREIEKNTATYAANQLMKHLGKEEEPIEFDIHKKMPFNSGLGSSAASAVAGVMAINEYFGRPLHKKDLLPFAVEGEQIADGAIHADNVAPSLLGGIVLVKNVLRNETVQLPIPRGLFVCVIHPHIHVPTKEARAILKDSISLKDHTFQSAQLASFITSLYTSDFDLMANSMVDHIIEPQRCQMIPFFKEMKDIALKSEAVGFGISGAGPSVFALASSSMNAEMIVGKIRTFLNLKKMNFDYYISKVNQTGAFRY